MRDSSVAYNEKRPGRKKGNRLNRINVQQTINKKRMSVMSTQETEISTQEIIITPEAAEQIRNIRRENQIPDTHGLRIGIQSGGCCGSSYSLAFDDKVEATDRVFQSEGVSIYVDEENLGSLSGTTLEFVDGPNGKGFRFDNPNQSKSCGCGDNPEKDKSCSCGDH
jgi:iron-sulfur cluster assembly protein